MWRLQNWMTWMKLIKVYCWEPLSMRHCRCWSKVTKKCKCLQINGEISPLIEGTLIGVLHFWWNNVQLKKKNKSIWQLWLWWLYNLESSWTFLRRGSLLINRNKSGMLNLSILSSCFRQLGSMGIWKLGDVTLRNHFVSETKCSILSWSQKFNLDWLS